MKYNLKKVQARKVETWNSFPISSESCVSLRKTLDIAVDKMEISPVARVSENLGCGTSVAS